MPHASNSGSLLLSVGVQCHAGKVRAENQDRVARATLAYGELFVVADGVGGGQGGAEAAQTTVDGFASLLSANSRVSLPEALQRAANLIQSDLRSRSARNPHLQGMGSTVAVCVISGDVATYGHIGDSRIYLLRDGRLTQLTRDHSQVERMVAEGILTPEQAAVHPDASVLTRALGHGGDIVLETGELPLRAGDALLLCSDGLWAYARHKDMEAVARSASWPAAAIAEALLDLAMQGGGGDNISIEFIRCEAAEPTAE